MNFISFEIQIHMNCIRYELKRQGKSIMVQEQPPMWTCAPQTSTALPERLNVLREDFSPDPRATAGSEQSHIPREQTSTTREQTETVRSALTSEPQRPQQIMRKLGLERKAINASLYPLLL